MSCHILSFWVLSHFEILSFFLQILRFWVVTFWIFLVLLHFEFFYVNIFFSFVKFWNFEICHILSFWFFFFTFWAFQFCNISFFSEKSYFLEFLMKTVFWCQKGFGQNSFVVKFFFLIKIKITINPSVRRKNFFF